MLKGAIFDFDGTLADSLQVWLEVDRRFLAARKLTCPPDYIKTIRHLNFTSGAEYTIAYFGLKETPRAVLNEWNQLALEMYRTEVDLKPGVKDYLAFLRQKGVKLALATSSVPDLCLPLLEKNDLVESFAAIITAEDVPIPKTRPDIFIRAAAELKLEPAEIAVYEDLAAAIRVARTAGFYTVGIYDPAAEEEWQTIRQEADRAYRSFLNQIPHSPFN